LERGEITGINALAEGRLGELSANNLNH
jgi:hypothetical protein